MRGTSLSASAYHCRKSVWGKYRVQFMDCVFNYTVHKAERQVDRLRCLCHMPVMLSTIFVSSVMMFTTHHSPAVQAYTTYISMIL